MSLRGLVLLLVCLVLGCTGQVVNEGDCDDMRSILDARFNRPEHWGNSVPLRGNWQAGNLRQVLQKPPYKAVVNGVSHYCVPQVQSLLLKSAVTGTVAGNFAFRWVLSVGGGGGRSDIKFDMLNTQQLSVAGENLSVNVLCEKFEPALPFGAPGPNTVVETSVSMADGNVNSSPATYTQAFSVAPADVLEITIPPMASAWRIIGRTGAPTFPLVAGVTVQFAVNGYLTVTYDGGNLDQNSMPGYISLPGNASSMGLLNGTGNTVQGLVQWELDL